MRAVLKVNTALLIATILALIIGMFLILPIISSALNWSMEQLMIDQKNYIKEIILTSFNDKKSYLHRLGKIIQSDANLAGSFLLARESNDYNLFKELTDEYKRSSSVNYFSVITDEGISDYDTELKECVTLAITNKKVDYLCHLKGNVVFLHFAPLLLYGEQVGRLLLGSNLTFYKESEEARSTTINDFYLSQNKYITESRTANMSEVYSLDNQAVFVELKPNNSSLVNVYETLKKVLFGASLITVLLALMFIFIIFRKLFINPINHIVNHLDEAFNNIEEGKDFSFKEINFSFKENIKLTKALNVFIKKIREYELKLKSSNEKLIANEKMIAIGNIARQVAHDIRSPLTALSLVVRSADKLPEAYRELLITGVERVNSIANDLLLKYQNEDSRRLPLKRKGIYSILTPVFSEKQLICESRGIILKVNSRDKLESYQLPLQDVQIQNITSNIINNSIDACSAAKKITITLEVLNNMCKISVEDTGKGIPPNILEQLGNKELSYGKDNGNGLGILSSNQLITKAGGQLRISSQVNVGTLVEIDLPISENSSNCEKPKTLESIEILDDAEIVIIDDDRAVHEAWRLRLSEVSLSRTIIITHFFTASEFQSAFANTSSNKLRQYFIDYDFNDPDITGIDIILNNKIQNQSVLVTSKYNSPEVIEKAVAHNLSILPKPLLATAIIKLISVEE